MTKSAGTEPWRDQLFEADIAQKVIRQFGKPRYVSVVLSTIPDVLRPVAQRHEKTGWYVGTYAQCLVHGSTFQVRQALQSDRLAG